MRRTVLPDYNDPCGWNAMLPARSVRPAATGTLRAKYAVVGAGYTGLAAARRLQELDPHNEVVLLEGSVIGEGSSARNSGFMTPRDSKIGLSVEDIPRAEKINAFSEEGFSYLQQAMAAGGFGIDLVRSGRITAAATDLGAKKIKTMHEGASAHGFAHAFLQGEALAAVIGTRYYQCALKIDEGYVMQPAKLVRGLADNLPSGVHLYENSPVVDVAQNPQGAGWRVTTDKAVIHADHVVLATNAAIKSFGYWRDRVVTIYTYAGISEAMDQNDAAALGSPDWGLLPAHRLGTTVRRVDHNRLMVRSLYAYEKPLDPALVRRALTGCFHRRYPMLEKISLEHIWGGTTALTMNGSPVWGQIRKGLYGSAGCNGSGVVKGTVLGKRLAEMIVTGDPQETLQQVYGRADWIAPEPFRTLGFHVISAFERRKAGLEM
jgi:glycine/D-amino acid oxidase-like deaminating enzyme